MHSSHISFSSLEKLAVFSFTVACPLAPLFEPSLLNGLSAIYRALFSDHQQNNTFYNDSQKQFNTGHREEEDMHKLLQQLVAE